MGAKRAVPASAGVLAPPERGGRVHRPRRVSILGTLVFSALREVAVAQGKCYLMLRGRVAIAAMRTAPQSLWNRVTERGGLRLFFRRSAG